MRRSISLLVVLAAFSAVCIPAPAVAATAALSPPTDAPILDPFRLPNGPFAAGNRGIEYDTAAGASIRAAGPGIVVFAGPVGGSLHITVDHGAGLLSSYSFVDQILIRQGDSVLRGQRLATAGGPSHFGTRVDGRYVDPQTLFGIRLVSVALIPHGDGEVLARYLDLAERAEKLQFIELWGLGDGSSPWDALRGALELVINGPGSPWGFLDPQARLEELVHLVDLALTLAYEVDPERLIAELVVGLWEALNPPPCTPAGQAVAALGGRRIALVVDGLDSSSGAPGSMAQLDLPDQGYDGSDVVRFSYNGGVVPPGGEGWTAGMPSSDYNPADTRGGVEAAIDKLAATLEAVARANPGVPIDVYGHSLGGLLARHALNAIDLAAVPVEVAVTIAAPHQGTASAEFLEVIEQTTPGTIAADVLELAWPDHLLVAPVVEDLSKSGFAGDTASVAFPASVHAVTIGVRGDVVVPATDAFAPGASHVVVGDSSPFGAHGGAPGLPEVAREVELALAGLPPACEDAVDRILDVVVPRTIEYSEHVAAGGAFVVDLPSP